jgi:hypothetical protein
MNRNPLDTLRVTSPCSEGWERMTGDDRVRHCEQCDKNVFDLSRFSRDEAEGVVRAFRGELCIRLTRRPDGSIVTREAEIPAAPVSAPIRLRRAGPVAGVALGLVLGVSGTAYAQETIENEPVSAKPTVVALGAKDEVTQTDEAFANVTGTVRRGDGGATRAILTLVNTVTGQYFVTTIPENGTFLFSNLPGGGYRLFVQGMDFHYFPVVRGRVVNPGQTWREDVVLNQQTSVVDGGVMFSVNLGSLIDWIQSDDPSLYARVVSIAPIPGKETPEPATESKIAYRVVLEVDKHLRGRKMPRRFEVQEFFDRGKPVPIAPGNIVFVRLFDNADDFVPLAMMPLDRPFGPEANFFREFMRLTYSRTPSRQEVVEWLVNGAVDSGSRPTAAGEIFHAIENWGRLEPHGPTLSKDDPFNMAADGPDFLSPAQKNRLMKALAETRAIGEHDRSLVELVSHFEHPDFVPFLVRYLRENNELPGEGNLLALEMLAKQNGNGRIESFFTIYAQVEDSNRSALYFTEPDSKDGKPLDEEAVKLEARKRAREELTALIRAALWAYDHPETP